MNFESFLKTFDKIEPLSNFQIIDQCKKLKIKNFKGVFMRNELAKPVTVNKNECFILNLDDKDGNGTHWTCLYIQNGICYYFDSFGFPPPIEVEEYLSKVSKRYYNSFEIQKINQVICGHFCIYVLFKLNGGINFYVILDELYKQ
jgi:hypothetical protein